MVYGFEKEECNQGVGVSKEIEEVFYLLFVKSSTLPVWFHKYKPTLEAAGTAIISIMRVDVFDKHGKELYRIIFQVDVYCSETEGISMDEVEYIDHMLESSFKNRLAVNNYSLVDYDMSAIVDNRGLYKMAPDGFERVMMWGAITFEKTSD